MPAQLPQCADCGATLKSVPVWLATASVRFTCNSCPKRPHKSPAAARFDVPVDAVVPMLAEPDDVVDVEGGEEGDDMMEMDAAPDELEALPDELEAAPDEAEELSAGQAV